MRCSAPRTSPTSTASCTSASTVADPATATPDNPSGIYRVADGSAELVADLSTWVRENPVAAIPGDSDPDGAGYSLVVEPESGTLWVDDPNSGQILSVAADGTVSRVVDLSDPHIVPTRLALDPAGGVFVGTLTTVPFPDGAAQVMHVATDGTVEVVWTGLTTVVDVAVGADGTLYALEMSTGNLTEPPFFVPGSGRIVRQTGPDTAEVVHEGLMFPIAMEIGPDGAFYVSTPAIGANDGSGAIVRLEGAMTDGSVPAASEPAASEPAGMPKPRQLRRAPRSKAPPDRCRPLRGQLLRGRRQRRRQHLRRHPRRRQHRACAASAPAGTGRPHRRRHRTPPSRSRTSPSARLSCRLPPARP